jgi:hypothetical protein
MLPRTPDDPTLDSGGCSDCARLEGAACFVATGALSCAASAALCCSCASFLAASSAARSSQYCGASESTGNIVLFRARVEPEGVCRRLVVRCEGSRGLIIKIQQSCGRLRFLPRECPCPCPLTTMRAAQLARYNGISHPWTDDLRCAIGKSDRGRAGTNSKSRVCWKSLARPPFCRYFDVVVS